MKNIVKQIIEMKETYCNKTPNPEAMEVSRQKFTLLLSGISSCRKVPGISEHMGFDKLYHCEDKESADLVAAHLNNLYGITDKDSLIQVCSAMYNSGDEYQQFMTFWNNAPIFELSELNAAGLDKFTKCKALAENFYPIVKEKGLHAWDINEKIGLCRLAVACGIISEDDFWELTDECVLYAQVFYKSFAEYAISCVCGALYDMARYNEDVSQFFEINRNLVDYLLDDESAWDRYKWYTPQQREWADLLGANPGCFVTQRVLDENKVGYMYKEEPEKDKPDSGWRFFVGDETEEYISNADNLTVCGVNSLCNLFPELIAFMHAKTGSAFEKSPFGWRKVEG